MSSWQMSYISSKTMNPNYGSHQTHMGTLYKTKQRKTELPNILSDLLNVETENVYIS